MRANKAVTAMGANMTRAVPVCQSATEARLARSRSGDVPGQDKDHDQWITKISPSDPAYWYGGTLGITYAVWSVVRRASPCRCLPCFSQTLSAATTQVLPAIALIARRSPGPVFRLWS